jgi:hypothetical protein
MDGSKKPRRYPAVRRDTRTLPANQRFSAFGNTVQEDPPYPAPLVFAAADLAPKNPSGKVDTLLKTEVKDRDITLTVALPFNASPTDTIDLELNGVARGKPIALDPFFGPPETDITIVLAKDDHLLLDEGRVDINYVVKFLSGIGDSQHGTPGQFYTTDYTPPGGPLLGQLVFSADVNENGVTEAALQGDGDDAYLPARVPGYTGHDTDSADTVTGVVGGNEETVDAILVGNGDIELHFKRSFIEQLDDGIIEFSYFVTDRAGNVSIRAEPVTLQVLLKDAIADLDTPLVPAYDDDDDTGGVPKLIDEADARVTRGLTVVIPANSNIKAGDEVLVYWGVLEVGPVPIADPAGDPLASVGVSYGAISDAWNGETAGADQVQTLDVSYAILRGGLSAGRPATPATVAVNLHQAGGEDPDPETPENENFSAPTLTSASGDSDVIPPKDFEADATITVPWFRADNATLAAFIDGDTLTVRYGAKDLPPRTISATDVSDAKDLVVTLTAADILATGSGPSIPLQFFVSRKLAAGGQNTSSSPVKAIKVSGLDELPGGGQPLPPLLVPEALGADTIHPDRLIIGRAQAKDGTDFVIPAYVNQDPGDMIILSMGVFRLFYYLGGHPGDLPANGGGARDLVVDDIHPTDASSDTLVHVTEVQLMHHEFLSQPLHGHIVYSVVGVKRPDTLVTSELCLLDIDPRGTKSVVSGI